MGQWPPLTLPERYQIWGGHRPIVDAPQVCFRYPICCCVSKSERFKGDQLENRDKISDFIDTVKIRGETREISESVYRARPKTQPLIYFWWGADRRSGRLEVGWQRSSAAIRHNTSRLSVFTVSSTLIWAVLTGPADWLCHILDPYAMHIGGCLESYYCNMVEWSWWDSGLICKINWFPSVLWHCWFGHMTCKTRPRYDL